MSLQPVRKEEWSVERGGGRWRFSDGDRPRSTPSRPSAWLPAFLSPCTASPHVLPQCSVPLRLWQAVQVCDGVGVGKLLI